jgi:hypothetical protein
VAVVDLLLWRNDVPQQDGRFADKETAIILGTVDISFTY